MSQSTALSRSIVLNARPRGASTESDFHIENDAVPTPEVGQVLPHSLHLSPDPCMPSGMSDGSSRTAPQAIGDVGVGFTGDMELREGKNFEEPTVHSAQD